VFQVVFQGVCGLPSSLPLSPVSCILLLCGPFSVAPSESERDGTSMLKFHLSFVAATTRMKDNGGGWWKEKGRERKRSKEADDEAHALFGSAFSGLFFYAGTSE